MMYRLGFKEEIDGKRKRGIPDKGTDLVKISSVQLGVKHTVWAEESLK